VTLTVILLILSLPLLITVLVITFVSIQRSPVFTQDRPGKDGKIFKLLKIKTMSDAVDEDGVLLPDADRLTNIGSLVRGLSLDELPQLLNVVMGSMSLVGPRPLLEEYLDLYNANQHRRHTVRPGITGWAQVNGRNDISWEEKFDYDIWYVKNISLLLDMKIIYLTIKKVIIKEGINSQTSVTMEKFKGSK